jgi:hypothetical protein
MRLGKIVEGGQFEIVWSSEKPIRPEPYPSSRSAAAWNEFLAGLSREWDGGTGLNLCQVFGQGRRPAEHQRLAGTAG